MAVGGDPLEHKPATPAHYMVTQPSMPTNEPPVTYSAFRRLASRCRFSRACPVADCRRWGGLPRGPLTPPCPDDCRRPADNGQAGRYRLKRRTRLRSLPSRSSGTARRSARRRRRVGEDTCKVKDLIPRQPTSSPGRLVPRPNAPAATKEANPGNLPIDRFGKLCHFSYRKKFGGQPEEWDDATGQSLLCCRFARLRGTIDCTNGC